MPLANGTPAESEVLTVPARLPLYFVVECSDSAVRNQSCQMAFAAVQDVMAWLETIKCPSIVFTVIGFGSAAFQVCPLTPVSLGQSLVKGARLEAVTGCGRAVFDAAVRVLEQSVKNELVDIGDADSKPVVLVFSSRLPPESVFATKALSLIPGRVALVETQVGSDFRVSHQHVKDGAVSSADGLEGLQAFIGGRIQEHMKRRHRLVNVLSSY